VGDVMGFFGEHPTIELVPPDANSRGNPREEGWKAEGPEQVRKVLEWCRENNLTIEQSRDYLVDDLVEEDEPGKKAVTCWVLTTSDSFGELFDGSVKGRVKVVVGGGKVEHLAFYPLSSKVMKRLKEEMGNLIRHS
jgi:hypothetical protein